MQLGRSILLNLFDNSEVILSLRENSTTAYFSHAQYLRGCLCSLEERVHSALGKQSILTTICINKFGINKADSEIMEHSRLMKIAKGCEVIFTDKYVRVS